MLFTCEVRSARCFVDWEPPDSNDDCSHKAKKRGKNIKDIHASLLLLPIQALNDRIHYEIVDQPLSLRTQLD